MKMFDVFNWHSVMWPTETQPMLKFITTLDKQDSFLTVELQWFFDFQFLLLWNFNYITSIVSNVSKWLYIHIRQDCCTG